MTSTVCQVRIPPIHWPQSVIKYRMHKISKTGPEYADHCLYQEGAGCLLRQERPFLAVSGLSFR